MRNDTRVSKGVKLHGNTKCVDCGVTRAKSTGWGVRLDWHDNRYRCEECYETRWIYSNPAGTADNKG